MKKVRRVGPPAPVVVQAEDVDFSALMRQEGVARVDAGRHGRRHGGRRAGAATGTRVVEVTGAEAVKRAVEVKGGRAVESTSAVKRAVESASASAVETGERAVESTSVSARVVREVEGLRVERDALVVRAQRLERERDAALAEVVAVRGELRALEGRASATRAELGALRAAAPGPCVSLAQLLGARGLIGAAEQARALAVLAGTESAPRLLAALETRDLAGVASALERRLALVCGDPGCDPEVGAAVLSVERARCEVCGGSDIRRAAHGFIRACAAAGVVRVRFVGGSPNYRTRLAALFPDGGALTVRTTAGDQRVRLNRSKLQQRSDDLVIVWGASELDHATSGVYRAEHGRTEIIAHRGIGRMLELASERLAVGRVRA